MYWINHELCTGCLVCAEACTTPGALIVRRGRPIINVAVCQECGACAEACSQGAIMAVERPVELMNVRFEPQKETAATRGPTPPPAVDRAKEIAETGPPLLGSLLGTGRVIGPSAGGGGCGRRGHRRRGGGARGGRGQGARRSW